jgi:hypothetical protein
MNAEAIRRMNPQEVKRSKTIYYLRQTRANGISSGECAPLVHIVRFIIYLFSSGPEPFW